MQLLNKFFLNTLYTVLENKTENFQLWNEFELMPYENFSIDERTFGKQ